MLEKTLHFLETAMFFHSKPAYNLPCYHVKKATKIRFLFTGITSMSISGCNYLIFRSF